VGDQIRVTMVGHNRGQCVNQANSLVGNHVYDADTVHCVLTILRPGKTPDGKEVSAHMRRRVPRIRARASPGRA
jgi:hypothetical protein